MLKIYDTLTAIIGEQAALETIKILVTCFNFYITAEEIQKLHIIF